MSGKALISIVVLVIAVTLGLSSVYLVDQREKAIIFQFGEIVRSNDSPGLHFKAPLINNVRYFDARVQTMDSDPELYLTREKKESRGGFFRQVANYRRGTLLHTTGGLAANARNRLAQRVNDALRSEFGNRSVQQVISGDRVEIMDVVREAMNTEVASPRN